MLPDRRKSCNALKSFELLLTSGPIDGQDARITATRDSEHRMHVGRRLPPIREHAELLPPVAVDRALARLGIHERRVRAQRCGAGCEVLAPEEVFHVRPRSE